MPSPTGFVAKVQVEGGAQLRAALLTAGDDLSDLTRTHKEAADKVRGEAKARVPVLTGNLGGSIGSWGTKYAGYVTAGRRGVVPYAGPIHFGWPAHNIEAQPFLYDALSDRKEQIVDLYRQRVEVMVRRIDATTPG